MNWTSLSIVRIGSGALFALLLTFALARAANAQTAPAVWFENQRLALAHPTAQKGDYAVALHDRGVQALLALTGASVAWQPGERYVLLTTAEPRIISFAVGDTRYDIGDISSQAAFAPFERNGEVYLPFLALARALYLEPKVDRGDIILQPQIAVAEIQSARDSSAIIFHAALPLKGRKVAIAPDRVVYDFPGFGSMLERSRNVHANGISKVLVESGGSARDPITRITVLLTPGATVGEGISGSYHDFSLAFSTREEPSPAVAEATESPSPSPVPSLVVTLATVTTVEGTQNGDEFDVRVAVSGNANYEWHRLLDDRWYVDIHGATVSAPQGDTPLSEPNVVSLRVHQLKSDTVRIALTLAADKEIDVLPSQSGLSIAVKDAQSDPVARSGSGSIGTTAIVNVTPAPAVTPAGWKFGNLAPPSANPRLIVIDPGHGGSDPGAQNSGLSEKAITLDISSRLRSILVARGWTVQMTRSTDTDVYGAGASDHDELQARVDVANQNGARLFVSVHVNSFSGAGPHGTTTYFYKAEDLAFANAVHRRLLAAALGTKDDGVIKNNFFVVVHTAMPAVLVETAFLSNPDDRALLRSTEFLQKIAQAIADGIGDYAGPPGSTVQSLQR